MESQTVTIEGSKESEPAGGQSLGGYRAKMATLGAYMLTGAATGVAAGVLARLAMRGVVYLVGGAPGFSIEGSVGIAALFAMLGLIVTAIYLVALRWLPRSIKWRAALVVGALLVVTLPFFFAVATGDLPDVGMGRVAALILLFVPLPILMGLGLVMWGERLEARFAQRGDATVGAGWAAVFVAMPILLIINLMGAAQNYMRHPFLLSQMMGRVMISGDAAMNMAVVQGRALLIAIVVTSAWAVLTALLFYRDVQSGRSPLRATLLMALPIFTLTAVGSLPPVLAWLPGGDAALGIVQAVGVAMLIAAVALGEPERPLPRWAVTVCGVAWVVMAAWLSMAGLRDNETMGWVAWSAMAVALVTLIVVRPVGVRGWRASTALLAIFALGLLLLWAAGMGVDGLMLSGYTGYQTALSAPIFWVVWLLLPVAALTTVRRAVVVGKEHVMGEYPGQVPMLR